MGTRMLHLRRPEPEPEPEDPARLIRLQLADALARVREMTAYARDLEDENLRLKARSRRLLGEIERTERHYPGLW